MMLHSANDAAVAVSEAVGGTTARFVDQMNAQARKLGCEHTHFVTPNGLNDPQHYTTARDLATITEWALRIPFFNKLIDTRSYRIKRSINQKDVVMHRSPSDRFLFVYDGANGVKTGYTHQAGRCYVGSATRDEPAGPWRLVSVALHSATPEPDTVAMMNYGFSAFEPRLLVTEGAPQAQILVAGTRLGIPIVTRESLAVVVRKDEPHEISFHYGLTVNAPAPAGQKVGSLVVSVDGGHPYELPLFTGAAAPPPASWKHALFLRRALASLAGLLALGCLYGSTAKANRQRRAMLKTRSRTVDPEWTRPGKWTPGEDG
jgi:D-alanyl-D-alanine carboxypeptidase (penicillin-binding protein 5/6)